VWLEGLNTTLKTFDVFKLPYANASRHHVDSLYPGRVRFIKGSSAETVPRYISDVRAGVEPLCDLWFIDGDHKGGAWTDMSNAFKVAADGATIIADDCTHRFPAVRAGWRKAIAGGFVADTFNKTLNLPPPGGQKGWCVGRFVGGRQRR